VRGCSGVLLKSSSLHAKNVKSEDNSLSSWECDLCSHVVDPHAPGPLFPGKTLTLDNKPWELVPAAENSFAAAMGVYRERRFKDARVLLERFLADFSGKLVGSILESHNGYNAHGFVFSPI
jgi:SET and MYND domain-containing protein